MTEFKQEIAGRIAEMMNDKPLNDLAMTFLQATTHPKYSYNYHWQDRPIIQYPQDIVAMQELIWSIKPDLIIDATGSSSLAFESMQHLGHNGVVVCTTTVKWRRRKPLLTSWDSEEQRNTDRQN